jgi:hypothetical protein
LATRPHAELRVLGAPRGLSPSAPWPLYIAGTGFLVLAPLRRVRQASRAARVLAQQQLDLGVDAAQLVAIVAVMSVM